MKKSLPMYVLPIVLCWILASAPASAQEREVTPHYRLSAGAMGGYSLPILADNAETYRGGLAADVFLNFNPKLINNFLIQGNLGYTLFGYQAPRESTLSFIALALGPVYNVPLFSWMEINARVLGGYSLAILYDSVVDETRTAWYPAVKAGLGVNWVLSYNLNLNTSAGVRLFFSSDHPYGALSFSAALNYRAGQNPRLLEDRSIIIREVTIDPLFSALYKYYNTNRIGTLKIENVSKKVATNLVASFTVKEYMDYPKESSLQSRLGPGENMEIDLFSLFNNKVLTITEDTPLSAEVSVSYTVEDKDVVKAKSITFDLLNRNALIWDDDRKIASFITPKDTAVKVFARSVVQMFDAESVEAVNKNLQLAMQLFDALGAYGTTYVIDPSTPFIEFYQSKNAVDYVQYPRDTLRFKAGDCDDLTVLYCALLENIGVSTAFITGPGHIFMALDTGVADSSYQQISSSRDDLIFKEGSVWIPVEATASGKSFQEAWRLGAKKYREWARTGVENFYMAEDAWGEYVPVTLEESGWEPALPDKQRIAQTFIPDIDSFVSKEMQEKVGTIEEALKQDQQNPRLYNKLGIVYARFRRLPEAIDAFQKAIQMKADYAEAISNLGSIYYMTADFDRALIQYERAGDLLPENPRVKINIARAHYNLDNYEMASKYYEKALALDEEYREEYAYLGGSTEGGVKASGAGGEPAVVWEYD